MKTFHFYDASSGLFVGHSVSYSDDIPSSFIESITAAGLSFIERDVLDHESSRVDLKTGEVVDYQSPAPSESHEWDEHSKRWKLTAEAQEKHDASLSARARIIFLEAGQHRAIREFLLHSPGALDRLSAIDKEIAELRLDLL